MRRRTCELLRAVSAGWCEKINLGCSLRVVEFLVEPQRQLLVLHQMSRDLGVRSVDQGSTFHDTYSRPRQRFSVLRLRAAQEFAR